MSVDDSDAPPELLAARPGLRDTVNVVHHPVGGGPPGVPPRRYTREIHKSIVELIQAGNRPETAAAACGIGRREYFHWMALGRDGNPHMVAFTEDVEKALAQAEVEALAAVDVRGSADGAKWYLERARAAGYSKEVNAKVEAYLGEFMGRLKDGLPEEVYELVMRVAAGELVEAKPTFQLVGGVEPVDSDK